MWDPKLNRYRIDINWATTSLIDLLQKLSDRNFEFSKMEELVHGAIFKDKLNHEDFRTLSNYLHAVSYCNYLLELVVSEINAQHPELFEFDNNYIKSHLWIPK